MHSFVKLLSPGEQVVDNFPDPIFCITKEGLYLYVNQGFAKPLRMAPQQIIGKTILDIFPGEGGKQRLRALSGVFESGEEFSFEVEVKQDPVQYFITTITPIKDQAGTVTSALCSSKNITHLKTIDSNLKKSELLLRSMINGPQTIAIFSVGKHFEYLVFNFNHQKAMKNRWGVDIQPGMKLPELISDESVRQKVCHNLTRALAGEQFTLSTEWLLPPQARQSFEEIYAPIFDENHLVIGATIFVIDITQRKLAEKELAISKMAMDSAISGISLNDMNGIITYVNRASLDMWGYDSAQELIGKSVTSVWKADENRGLALSKIKTEGRWRGERTAVRKDGSEFEVELLGSLILDESGQPLGVHASLLDLTQRNQAAKEKNEIQAQLLHSLKLASIGTLAAGVAHEINNPLSIISGYTDILQKDIAANSLKNAANSIQKIQDAIRRILKIVDGLRTYSRQDNEEWHEVNVHVCLEDTISFVQSIYEKQNIEVESVFNAQRPFARANTGKLQQVLMNIFGNARDAYQGKREGKIVVKTFNRENLIIIEISDFGMGIKKEVMSKIFEPFFTTKEPGKGTGLGLSLSHTLITSFSGTLEAESEVGLGTTFRITLPILSKASIQKIEAPSPE